MNKNYIFRNMRISLLKDDILRFEYVPHGKFSNSETLFTKKKREENFVFDIHHEDKIWFNYEDLVIVFDENNPLNSLEIYQGDKRVYKYKIKRNSGELPLPNKTPFIFPIFDTPRIIVPESGYSTEEDFIYEKDTKDLYLLIARNDYQKLRKQYISLTGKNDMPRLKNFGLFNSRYYAWNQRGAKEMIKSYKEHGLPLDNFVLDTDWRELNKHHGTGYKVNEELFPDLAEFYRYAHERNVEVMMNDHPAPLMKKYNMLSKEEIEFRKDNLTHFFIMGLDTWWYDRNWSSRLVSPSKRVPVESLGRYLYHDITRQFYQGLVLDPEVYIRPVTLSNITEIKNGKYYAIKDSRSHTIPFQWSGDISSDAGVISEEVKNMNRCASNMLAYYSSDIGGHTSNPSRIEFIRWYQYGAFSPILRPHCTNSVVRFREPWVFGEKTLETVKSYINMRYRLLDVIYTNAYKHYENGLGIFRPLYLNYPDDKKAYKENLSYMLGDNILIHPLGGEPLVSLKKKHFKGSVFASFYDNKAFKGKPFTKKRLKTLEFDASDGHIYDDVPNEDFAARFKFALRFDQDVDLYIKNDDGARVYIDGKRVFNDWNDHAPILSYVQPLKANNVYRMKIEYYQGKGGATLELYYAPTIKKKKTKIYLPEGEWYNVTHRNVYQGRRYIKEKYELENMPLFVKAGSLLPLYKTVDNISKMSLKNIVYDYYPSREKVTEDYFYEDDGLTTGYQVGIRRISSYRLEFKDDHYLVTLIKSDNNLDDRLDARNVMFKMHVRDKEKVVKVLINDEPVRFKRHDHNKKVDPISGSEWARDSKTTCFKFRQELKKNYYIKIFIDKENE